MFGKRLIEHRARILPLGVAVEVELGQVARRETAGGRRATCLTPARGGDLAPSALAPVAAGDLRKSLQVALDENPVRGGKINYERVVGVRKAPKSKKKK